MTVEKRPVGSGWRAGKPRTRRKQRYVVKGVTYTSPLPWYGAAVELRLGEAAEELQMAVGELPVMVVDAVHRELQRLEDSTAKGYATYWAQFERFCDETGLCPLPAASITVRTFLSEDLAFRAKESSMQQYLSAINKAHGASPKAPPVAHTRRPWSKEPKVPRGVWIHMPSSSEKLPKSQEKNPTSERLPLSKKSPLSKSQ